MAQLISSLLMSVRTRRPLLSAALAILAMGLVALGGCRNDDQRAARRAEQAINAIKTKSDSIHDAMRYIGQITPQNREKIAYEVQLHLNKWLQSSPATASQAVPSELVEGLPPDMRSATGLDARTSGQFDAWDVEYLYQCRLYRQLSSWIVAQPLRDSLIQSWLSEQSGSMPAEEFGQLEQACKLFDWAVRNIVTYGEPSDVEKLLDDPRVPLSDSGIGYRYLPWQTILYARGDFVERGRVFTALALQRELPTTWVALRLPSSPSAKLWAVGVVIGQKIYLFEPKLGLPIMHPDTLALATLADVQSDPRVLRRLDVPGRFDYAVNANDAAKVEFLLESEPSGLSDRMASLQASLTGDDRLRLQPELKSLAERLKKLQPDAQVALWQTPLLARLYAANLRSRLELNSPFTAQYMLEHAIWVMNTSLSAARLKHLAGEFENTFDARGALATYMDCRLDDATINRLPDDPEVQRELAIPRGPVETLEEYQLRLQQFQKVFRQSKIDASFLLGQLQFDLGDYDSVEGWLKKRTLPNPQAGRWHAAARYTLARAYQEQGKLAEAIEQLNEDGSPMEAGNRLRVRYLSR
jgi:tetratricopeptide (TPR) repeat protein